MWWALVACLVLAGIHAYLGFHVVKRGVIFVDLAMAQIAAMGVAIAIVLNLHEHPVANYLFPIATTVIGAILFAWLRHLEHRVPLEAFIGITFASAQAVVLLLLEYSPSGTEHLKETLMGSIFTVDPDMVIKTAGIYSLIGLLHVLVRKPLMEITDLPKSAQAAGRSLFIWDVLFYATFGVVVTSSVRIAGVLLVFAFLVIPAVAGMLVSDRTSVRLVVGWSFGFLCSFAGLMVAFNLNTPAAPTILILLTLSLLLHGTLVTIVRRIRSH